MGMSSYVMDAWDLTKLIQERAKDDDEETLYIRLDPVTGEFVRIKQEDI